VLIYNPDRTNGTGRAAAAGRCAVAAGAAAGTFFYETPSRRRTFGFPPSPQAEQQPFDVLVIVWLTTVGIIRCSD
jgi:hypothetical protein